MGRNKCKKIQPLQSLPIRSSPALLSCLRQPQAPSPEHPLRLLVFQTYRLNSILCFTMSANLTPMTASSNSNSKIPSKFFSANVVQDDHAPLWAYVSIRDKGSEAGGNKKWSCNFCQKEFRSSYYVHTNLRLLGRKSEEYNQGSTKMWDISGDAWDSFDGVGNLEVASLSLDEPDIEAVLFTDDAEGGDEIDTVPVSRQ